MISLWAETQGPFVPSYSNKALLMFPPRGLAGVGYLVAWMMPCLRHGIVRERSMRVHTAIIGGKMEDTYGITIGVWVGGGRACGQGREKQHGIARERSTSAQEDHIIGVWVGGLVGRGNYDCFLGAGGPGCVVSCCLLPLNRALWYGWYSCVCRRPAICMPPL